MAETKAHLTFLDLPLEIRNQIYSQLLVLPTKPGNRYLQLVPARIYPEILYTCPKIYDEAKLILYGCNTFLAHPNLLSTLPRLSAYYDVIRSHNITPLIRRYLVRVRLDCDASFTAEEAKDAFAGVDELTIDVFQAQFGSSDYKTLRLFESVRAVKRAEIIGSVVAFPEYANWLQKCITMPIGSDVIPFEEVGDGAADVRTRDI